MNNIKSKSNKHFMLLTFLGIIFMLDDHSGHTFNIMTNIFPYNSFYMPLFFFISGYFCDISRIINGDSIQFIQRKTKHLLLPYLSINIFLGIITVICNKYFHTEWRNAYPFVSANKLLDWFTYGTPIDLSSPMWFVICLYETIVIYCFIRKMFKNKITEGIYLFAFGIISILSVYLSRLGYAQNEILLPFIKVMFFLFYYQFGVVFRVHQKKFDNNGRLILWGGNCFKYCFITNFYITRIMF